MGQHIPKWLAYMTGGVSPTPSPGVLRLSCLHFGKREDPGDEVVLEVSNHNMAPKIVLVTGCSTGIGLYTALLLASDKEKRFIVYATLRNLAKKGELEEKGKDFLDDTLIIKAMDVCSDESVDDVVQDVLSTHQRIDILSKVSIFFELILMYY